MANVKEIVLRKPKADNSDKLHQVRIYDIDRNEPLFLSIVLDKQNSVIKRFKIEPEQLAGKKNILFRVSGHDIYWLGKLTPTQIDEVSAPEEEVEQIIEPELAPEPEQEEKIDRRKLPIHRLFLLQLSFEVLIKEEHNITIVRIQIFDIVAQVIEII